MLIAVVTLAAVPAAVITHSMVSQAVGRTTVVADSEGRERAVYWRDYPGIAGLDPQEVLQGPTPEEGHTAGEEVIAEIRAALSRELQLAWAPPGQDDVGLFVDRVQNYFGGESLLSVVNALPSDSTSVPRVWADKLRALDIIGTVIAPHGYSAPVLETFELWSEEDLVRDLGGATPETQVVVSAMAEGPAGQWLSITFQDLSKDTTGKFRERLAGPGRQLDAVSISYGANGLLHAADRDAFDKRLAPFLGLTPPAPLET